MTGITEHNGGQPGERVPELGLRDIDTHNATAGSEERSSMSATAAAHVDQHAAACVVQFRDGSADHTAFGVIVAVVVGVVPVGMLVVAGRRHSEIMTRRPAAFPLERDPSPRRPAQRPRTIGPTRTPVTVPRSAPRSRLAPTSTQFERFEYLPPPVE